MMLVKPERIVEILIDNGYCDWLRLLVDSGRSTCHVSTAFSYGDPSQSCCMLNHKNHGPSWVAGLRNAGLSIIIKHEPVHGFDVSISLGSTILHNRDQPCNPTILHLTNHYSPLLTSIHHSQHFLGSVQPLLTFVNHLTIVIELVGAY